MNRSSSSEWSGSAIKAELVCKGGFGLVERHVMLLAISGILARIPVKGKMAHKLHCNYRVRTVKAPSQILLTPAWLTRRFGAALRRKIGRRAAVCVRPAWA